VADATALQNLLIGKPRPYREAGSSSARVVTIVLRTADNGFKCPDYPEIPGDKAGIQRERYHSLCPRRRRRRRPPGSAATALRVRAGVADHPVPVVGDCVSRGVAH